VTLALLTRRWLDDGQSFAAAETTAFQHGTAGGSEHPLQKAVFAFSWDALRLVGTFGHAFGP
jgi:hypothetical protein